MTSSEQKDLREIVVYILIQTKGLDFYHLFKVLYFAEMEHLATWGVRMISDNFYALKYGPVPSGLYDAIKHFDSPSLELVILLREAIEFAGSDAPATLLAKRDADMSRISKACKEVLDKSIAENATPPFATLMNKSHDKAWKSAYEGSSNIMCPIAIAREKGIDDCTLAYLEEHLPITAALS